MNLGGSVYVGDADCTRIGMGMVGLRLAADACGRAAMAVALGADPTVISALSDVWWRIQASPAFRGATGGGPKLPSWPRIKKILDLEYSGRDEHTGQTDRQALALSLEFEATQKLYEQGGRERVWAMVQELSVDHPEDPLMQIFVLGVCLLRFAHDQKFRDRLIDASIKLGALDEAPKKRTIERLVAAELGSNRIRERDSSRSTVLIDNERLREDLPDPDDQLSALQDIRNVLQTLSSSEARAIRCELEALKWDLTFTAYLRAQGRCEREIRSMQRSRQRAHQRIRREPKIL